MVDVGCCSDCAPVVPIPHDDRYFFSAENSPPNHYQDLLLELRGKTVLKVVLSTLLSHLDVVTCPSQPDIVLVSPDDLLPISFSSMLMGKYKVSLLFLCDGLEKDFLACNLLVVTLKIKHFL